MKKISVLFTVLILAAVVSAQVKGGSESKLFDLYAFEKYEDCAYKAEAMTQNDKTRNSPEPYLYLAMCYVQISKKSPDELDQAYKDPIKDALKYAYKFRKKDKTNELYEQNVDFFAELKHVGIYRAKEEFNNGQPKKASYYYSAINKFDYDDDNIRLMSGICNIMAMNSQGAIEIKNALQGINKKYKNSSYKPDKVSEPVLIDAFIKYSNYLMEKSQEDSAKATITIAKDLLPEIKEIVKHYNKLYGIKEEEKKEEKKNSMNMVYEKHVTKVSKDSLKTVRDMKKAESLKETE